MSRSWCPALSAADADTTSFSSQLRGTQRSAHPPESRQQQPSSPAKLKSLLAAKSSAASELVGQMSPCGPAADDASPAAATTEISRFSSRIAISTFNGKVFADTVLSEADGAGEEPPVPAVVFNTVSADEYSSTAPVGTKLAVRSVKLLERLEDFVSSCSDETAGLEDAMSNISLSKVDMASDEIASAVSKLRAKFWITRGLDLSHTMRGTTGAQALTRVLQGVDEDPLRMLDISDNPSALAEDTENFGKLLQKLPNLHALNISGTGVGPSLGTLAPLLQTQSTIINLGLGSNAIGAQEETAVAAVATLLQENKFLLQVDLSNNELSAAALKQLADAIAASDTRAKTPEPEAEPETEEFTDEVPPEEEAPAVTVGFPQEEKPEGAAPAATEGEPEPASPSAAAAAAESKSDAPHADGDEEEEEAPETSKTVKAAEELAAAAEEIDPEEAAAAEAAAAEAKRVAEEEALAAWRDKMTKYIWEPEQILLAYDEGKLRRGILCEYSAETIAFKKTEKAEKKQAKQLQLQREKKERERRSGWTHLQAINLRDNPMGSDGAKAVAKMLQHTVPLKMEEQQAAEEEYNRILSELRDVAVLQRKKVLQEKRRAAKLIEKEKAQAEAEREREAAQKKAAEEAAEAPQDTEGEGDPPAEDGAAAPAADEAPEEEEAVNALDEMEDDIPEDEIDVSDITAPAPKKDRAGVQSIQSLDISGCKIGAIGLKALAAVLKDNCPSLKVLNLANNKFATKKVAVAVPKAADAAQANEEDGEEETVKVDQIDFVSPGVVALSEALQSPAFALVSLDLSRNKLYPDSILKLAEGIRGNTSLLYLNLDDNFVGFREPEIVLASAPAVTAGKASAGAFLALLQAVSRQGQLSTLLLRNNILHGASTKEAWQTLFQRCANLKNLDLSSNGIDTADIRDMLEAINEGDGMQQLRLLNLADSRQLIGEDAGAILAQICVAQKKLKTLVLRGCSGLGDRGLDSLCEGFQNHSSLQNIILRRTGITYVETLGSVLPSISFLRHLDIADNEISMYASKKILADCASSPSLRTIQMWSRSPRTDEALDELLLAATELASSGSRTLLLADLGAPITFASGTQTIRFTPPPSAPVMGTPSYDDDASVVDPLEELEWLCLRNRLTASAAANR